MSSHPFSLVIKVFPLFLHPQGQLSDLTTQKGKGVPVLRKTVGDSTVARGNMGYVSSDPGDPSKWRTRENMLFWEPPSPCLCSPWILKPHSPSASQTYLTDQGAEVPKAFLNFYFNGPGSLNLIDFQIDCADQCTTPWRGKMVSSRTSSCTSASPLQCCSSTVGFSCNLLQPWSFWWVLEPDLQVTLWRDISKHLMKVKPDSHWNLVPNLLRCIWKSY